MNIKNEIDDIQFGKVENWPRKNGVYPENKRKKKS